MKMALCVATMRSGNAPGDIPLALTNATGQLRLSPDRETPLYIRHNIPEGNLGVVKSYQELYEKTDEDILCYMHDDVIVRERGWDERILLEFDDPEVGLVGFGGALWHGTSDLYKKPYALQNLRRGDYYSNVDDAEVHGSRFTGSRDVAVLDGYCLCVRRDLLDRMGGWSVAIQNGIDYLCYDYFLCAMTRRFGYRIRVVGVRCHHRGGQTSLGIDRQEEYDRSHRWFYEEFRDQMPWKVKA